MSKQGGYWLLAGIAVMAVVTALPSPSPLLHEAELVPLTVEGKATLAVLAFAVVLCVPKALANDGQRLCPPAVTRFWPYSKKFVFHHDPPP